MKFLYLALALMCSACTMTKAYHPKTFIYDFGEEGKLSVISIKRAPKKTEIKLLGISLGAHPIALKANEIECGIGTNKFEKVKATGNAENLIVLPKITYLEFEVFCYSEEDVDEDEDPYLVFKKLYQLDGKKTGKTMDSNIKIKFE